MRIIIPNLHANWMMVKNSAVIIFKNSAATKHSYLLNYLLNNPEYEVCTFINNRGFSIFNVGNGLFSKFMNLFSGLEHRFIMKKNGIDFKKVTVLKDVSDIRKDDIILIYNVMSDEYDCMDKIDAFKAVSMLHFHGNKNENAIIKSSNIACYYNESDLSKTSEIFKKYYHVEKPWIVIPFVFGERFKNMKPFNERQNKCFSTGTITYKKHEEFISVYGDPCDQPARKFVKDNPEFFKNTVDCYNSDYLEDNPGKTIKSTDNTFVKLYKKIYNKTLVGKQTKYFSFNMVEKFNDYKMHFLGEEILGVPGIGFVEGMACGSAYIGLDSPMYRDYGLIPGIHYISYDGTKEGLRTTVEYYQKPENQEELERIAKTGCEFVRKNFCGDKVAEMFMNKIMKEQQNWLNNK